MSVSSESLAPSSLFDSSSIITTTTATTVENQQPQPMAHHIPVLLFPAPNLPTPALGIQRAQNRQPEPTHAMDPSGVRGKSLDDQLCICCESCADILKVIFLVSPEVFVVVLILLILL